MNWNHLFIDYELNFPNMKILDSILLDSISWDGNGGRFDKI